MGLCSRFLMYRFRVAEPDTLIVVSGSSVVAIFDVCFFMCFLCYNFLSWSSWWLWATLTSSCGCLCCHRTACLLSDCIVNLMNEPSFFPLYIELYCCFIVKPWYVFLFLFGEKSFIVSDDWVKSALRKWATICLQNSEQGYTSNDNLGLIQPHIGS